MALTSDRIVIQIRNDASVNNCLSFHHHTHCAIDEGDQRPQEPFNDLSMAELSLDSSVIPALHKPSALLPIAKHRESLLYLIENYIVTIVVGQTGSGKTTQIPQFLEKAGWCADGKLIAITQVSTARSLLCSPHH